MFRRRHREPVDEAQVDRLRRLYAALGLGFPAEASQVFGGEEHWCLSRLGRRVRCLGTADISNQELFYLPGAWEVIRVVTRTVSAQPSKWGDMITVFGDLYCRPHGTWENIRIPFQHIWTLCDGRALLFENVLDATDLKPDGKLVACGA